MAELDDLSTTDDSNTARFPENMQFRQVNDAGRELEGLLARHHKDTNGSLTAGGSSNVFTITPNRTITAYTDALVLAFTANHTTTGPTTLNVSGLGAKPVKSANGSALTGGEIVSGQKVRVVYRASTDDFQIEGGAAPSLTSQSITGSLIKIGTPVLSMSPTPATGYIRLTQTTQTLNKADWPELNTYLSGISYPWGSASTTFNLPPAAGYFLRFAATSSAIDTSGARAAGSTQTDQNKAHTHTVTASGTTANDNHQHPYNKPVFQGLVPSTGSGGQLNSIATALTDGYNHTHTVTVSGTAASDGGDEVRVKNVAFHLDVYASSTLAAGTLGVFGFPYAWDTGTTAADPSTSRVRVNNATLASATAIYISETDGWSVNISGTIAAVTEDSIVKITKIGAPANVLVASVTAAPTDAGSYRSIPITVLTAAGSFSSSDSLAVEFVIAGTGADGAAGADGGGLKWTFDSSTTTAADPGAGDLRFNNATLSSATELSISYQSDEAGNPDVNSFVKSWDDSTNTAHYGTLVVRKNGDPDTFCVFNITSSITDGTTYGRFTISYVSPATPPTFTNGDVLSILFVRTGNKGTDGAGAGDVVGPAASIDSEIALYSGTTGKLLKRATTSGLLKATSGVLSAAAAGTDYVAATTGSAVQKASSGGLTAAAATDLGAGLHVIYVPATAMVSRTTNGAAAGTVETTTNKVMLKTLDFDTTTQEFAQFSVRMPKSWNEGTVTAAFTWSHASTTTNFGVVWALEGVALSDDDAGDAAFGTLQQIADTGGTTNDIYVSGATPAITIAGTPAAEDWVVFQIKRVPSDGSDTMAIDARLHGVTLYFTTDAITDA